MQWLPETTTIAHINHEDPRTHVVSGSHFVFALEDASVHVIFGAAIEPLPTGSLLHGLKLSCLRNGPFLGALRSPLAGFYSICMSSWGVLVLRRLAVARLWYRGYRLSLWGL